MALPPTKKSTFKLLPNRYLSVLVLVLLAALLQQSIKTNILLQTYCASVPFLEKNGDDSGPPPPPPPPPWKLLDDSLDQEIWKAKHQPINEWDYPEIDVVYTWVNGSDPEWLEIKTQRHEDFVLSLTKSTKVSERAFKRDQKKANGENRFRDHNELKYSMRSLEKHAPWIRLIHIVVADGQVPKWLNISHPKIRIVPHSAIFQNSEYLPTFNANAIESQLAFIPGLPGYFLYMNDDVFLGSHTDPSDYFVSPTSGQQKRYDDGKATRPFCEEEGECTYDMLQNQQCDAACNVPECNWDFGDCGGQEKVQQLKAELQSQLISSNQTFKPGGGSFGQFIQYVDGVFNRELKLRREPRNVISHMPHLISTTMMKDMLQRFQLEFNLTASHPFRHEQDMQLSNSYYYYLSAVQVYAPTIQQAWRAAFDTIDRPKTIFLYDHLPHEWDPVEYARYSEVTASAEYSKVELCTRAISAKERVDVPECMQSMKILVKSLRLPFDRDVLGDRSLTDFRMIEDEEEDAIEQLHQIAKHKKKFITINDNMRWYSAEIEDAMEEMYLSFFPTPSAYENGYYSH